MKSISRKIQLKKYGGHAYEMKEYYAEGDDFDTIEKEIEAQILKYITSMPAEAKKFQEAVDKQQPF